MVAWIEDMVTTLIHDVQDDQEDDHLDFQIAFQCIQSIIEVLTDLDNFANNQKFKNFDNTIGR